MAITYPLDIPTTIGFESIEIRAANAITTSQSPFTYKQQVVAHQGEQWEASISIPRSARNLAEPWAAFLVALKGPVGTFLLGDPASVEPRGTVSSCIISGDAGDDSAVVSMTGTLLAGDYIQLGTGSSAKLHKVLVDQDGDGALELWPSLRSSYTNQTVITSSAKGLFRLKQNMSSWGITSPAFYDISFEAVEVII